MDRQAYARKRGIVLLIVSCLASILLVSLVRAGSPPSVAVTYPNSGENISTRYMNITWAASDPDGDLISLNIFIDINNRSDDGSLQVGTSEPNDGLFTVDLLPLGLPEDQYFVRVDAVADIDRVTDYSNRPFYKRGFGLTASSQQYAANVSILQPPSISFPADFATSARGMYPVRFTVADPQGYDLFATVYNSSAAGNRTSVIFAGALRDYCADADNDTRTDNQCLVPWNTTFGGNVFIDIVVSDGDLSSSVSSPLIHVDNAPEIAVIFPNGGEVFDSRHMNILWTASDIPNYSVAVDLYYDDDDVAFNGRTLIKAGEGNDGTFTWDLHAVQPGDYYLSIDAQSSGIDSMGNQITVVNTEYSAGKFRKVGFNETFVSTFVSNNYAVIVNNAPRVVVVRPNGSETLNGSIQAVFNVSDLEGDYLAADIYYSTVKGGMEHLVAGDLSLDPSICLDPDFSTKTQNSCTISWNTAGLNGNYFLDVMITDSVLTGFDSSDTAFSVNNYPTVANVSISSVSNNSALVSWVTQDEMTNATVIYGQENFTNAAAQGAFSFAHAVNLTGLQGNRNYSLKVRSCDNTGLCTESGVYHFITVDNRPRVRIIAPNGGEVFSSSAITINWTAIDPESDPILIDLYYDNDNLSFNGRNLIASNVSNAGGSFNWSIVDLQKGSYYVSMDAKTVSIIEGTVKVEEYSDGSFEKSDILLQFASNVYAAVVGKNTLPVITVAVDGNFTNGTLFGNATVRFNVTDVEDLSLAVSLYYSAIPGGREHAIVTNLRAGQDICSLQQDLPSGGGVFSCVYVWDTDSLYGNFVLDIEADDSVHAGIGSSSSFVLNNMASISDLVVTDVDTHTVDVSYVTNKETNATIRYGLDLNYSLQVMNASLTRNHTLRIGNLAGNRRYHYRIISCDSTGFCSTNSGLDFTTQDNLPHVQVVYPAGGEIVSDQFLNILWNSSDDDGDAISINVYYDLDADPGNGRYLISGNEPDDGTFSWNLAGLLPGPYFIGIEAVSTSISTGQVTVDDYSDGPFTKGDAPVAYMSNSYDATVFQNTMPLADITAPVPFDILVGLTDINFTVTDNEGDSLFASLSYGGQIYRRTFIVQNPTAAPFSKYPVFAIIDTKALIEQHKLRPDAVELKILVNETEVPIFIESGLDTNATVIWFSVDLLPNQRREDIVLVYGASASLAMDRHEPDWSRFRESQNILAHKPIVSFSSEDVAYPAANSNDGDRNSKWRSTGTQDFIRFNLSGEFRPYKVTLVTGGGVNHSRARSSTDNTNYTIINDADFSNGTIQSISFKPIAMDYFLIDQITSASQNDLFEIELYTPSLIEALKGNESIGGDIYIVSGLDLSNPSNCNDPDGSTKTRNNCSYRWNMSQLDGEFCLRLGVSDLISDVTVSEVCNVTIDNINDYPVLLSSIPNMSWVVNTSKNNAFDLDSYFRDPNNNSLTYTVRGNSQINVFIDPLTHLVSFNQPSGFMGKEYVTFTADDGFRGVSDSNLVELFVTPTLPSISGIPDQFIPEDAPSPISIDLYDYSSDFEKNVTELVYAVVNQTNASVVPCSIFNVHFVRCGPPAANASGESRVFVSVFDGSSHAYDDFLISVVAVNDPPVIAQLPDKSFPQGSDPQDKWVDLWNFTSDNEDGLSSLDFSIAFETNPSLLTCQVASNRFVNCTTPGSAQSGISDVTVRAADTGNLSSTDTFRITVIPGDAPPAVSLVLPANGSVSESLPVVFEYLVTDPDDTYFLCNLTLNGTVVNADRNVSNNTAAQETVANLSTGRYAWRVTCRDHSHAVLTGFGQFMIRTDLAVSDLSFSDASPLQGEMISVFAAVHNTGGVHAYNVPVGMYVNATLFSTGAVTVPANDSTLVNMTFSTAPYAGEQMITVWINENQSIIESDVSNNNVSRMVNITQDVYPPTFNARIQIPANITEDTASLSIHVNVSDRGSGINPATVRTIYTLGTGVPQVAVMSSSDNRRFGVTVTPDFNAFRDGNFTYYIIAQDNKGNVNRTEDYVDYIDPMNNLPQVTIIKPDNMSSFDALAHLLWTVVDQDNDPVTSSLYYRTRGSLSSGSNAGQYVLIDTVAGTSYDWSTLALPAHYYQLLINASDASNTTFATSPIFTVDHSPPSSVTLVSPINSVVISADPVQFRFAAVDDMAPFLSCNLSVDGTLVESDMSVRNTSEFVQAVPGVIEGAHTWSVACSDRAGLVKTSDTAFFMVDRTRPTAILRDPANTQTFSQSVIIFNYSATDNLDTAIACSLLIDGAVKNSTSASNGIIMQVQVFGLKSQVHEWSVRCADDAGNQNTTEVRILNIQTDLSVSSGDISFNPVLPTQGTSTVISALIRNLGQSDAESVRVEFYDQFNVLVGNSLVSVPAQASSIAQATWDLAGYSSGTHLLRAVIQPGPYLDSNQGNNEASQDLTVALDMEAPVISPVILMGQNLTEHTVFAVFEANITDAGIGVDPAGVSLNFSVGATVGTKAMTKISDNLYRAVLNLSDVDFDQKQGMNLSAFVSAKDLNGNAATSILQTYYIFPINDLPVVTVFIPDNASQWSGKESVIFAVDNDHEGPVNSTLYYWEPFAYAPSYLENATAYFAQGHWIKIADVGNDSSYLWDTFGLSLFTKVNITSSDGVYTGSNASPAFIIDNGNVSLRIDNYFTGAAYVTRPDAEIVGEVASAFSTINGITVNDSRFNLLVDPRGHSRHAFSFRSGTIVASPFAIRINATTLSGTSGNIGAEFIIDSELPRINSMGFDNAFTNDLIVIAVNATDNIGIGEVRATFPFNITASNFSAILHEESGIFTAVFKGPPISGSYLVDIKVTDHAGNTVNSSTFMNVLDGPDLIVGNLTFDPDTTVTGLPVNVTAGIRNIGGKFASNVTVSFFASGQHIGDRNVDVTDSTAVTLLWYTTGFAGNKTVTARIMQSDGVFESNYSNNDRSAIIFIDGPDLKVENMTFAPPSPAFEGQIVMITGIITNKNGIPADDVRVSFYTDNVSLQGRIDFIDVDVPAHGTVNVSVGWQTAGFPGSTDIFVEANTNDLPADPDRSDNLMNATFETIRYVSEQVPDLLIFPERILPDISGEKVRGMASNDFDKDNRTDFVAGTDTGKVILYHNNGIYYTDGNTTKNVNFSKILIIDLGQAAWGMTSADFFRDDYPDLVVGTEDGSVIFFNNDQGIFDYNVTLMDVGDWAYGLAASDFDNDNIFDLVIGNKIGQVNLFINNKTEAPSGMMTNTTFIFNRTLTTRDLPFGLTSGDFDLDGHADIMVGDRLGQVEKIIWEDGGYNGFIFTDVGAFAHGLTVADVDYSNRLDLFTLSFDGNVRMFFSREGNLVANPLIIGNIKSSYGLTSGDYDNDNDVDLIVGSDDGNVTMLMNSLRIVKNAVPSPTPPRRPVEITTYIQNPWSRDMIEINLTEFWQESTHLVESAYMVCLDYYCEQQFYADMVFYGTPKDNATKKMAYYFKFPDTVCRQEILSWQGFPSIGCEFITFSHPTNLSQQGRMFGIDSVLDMFDHLDGMLLREGFSFKYKVFPEEVVDIAPTTVLNYTMLGEFNTVPTSFLLSDDVTNLNDVTANSKNINPDKTKTDRGFVPDHVIAPDFTPISLDFSYNFPPVPGEYISAHAVIRNLNDIAINDVKAMVFIDGKVLNFSGNPVRNYTFFDIGALGTAGLSASATIPSSPGGIVNVTVVLNPFRDDIETDYDNNNITNSVIAMPPADIQNDLITFSNESGVGKNVFTEGETMLVLANFSNVGMNRSYYETVLFRGFDPWAGCFGISPFSQTVNCTPGHPDYDAELCDGVENCYQRPGCSGMGNLEPGESNGTIQARLLGDRKMRTQGTYNFSTIISNVGALDENLANGAQYDRFTILPSQIDLLFDYYGCEEGTLGIEMSNPAGNNMSFAYYEMNNGGFDIPAYESIVYLDNNDSVILKRIVNETLMNHTADNNYFDLDWTNITPGDHIVNVYLDYGKDDIESTANASSKDGLVFIADSKGVIGNDLTVRIANREFERTRLDQQSIPGQTTISVESLAGLANGDFIRIDGEGVHQITDVNASTRVITFTPALSAYAHYHRTVFLYYPDIYTLNVTRLTSVFKQTAFDYQLVTDTESYRFDKTANGTDIQTVGDIVDVITDGGFTYGGNATPSTLIHVVSSFANLSAVPTPEVVPLIIPGTLTGERSDFNNQNIREFRWKEIVTSGISYNPPFPQARDIISVGASISNQGDIRTGPFNVTFFVDGIARNMTTISLLAHESKPVSFSFKVLEPAPLSYDVQISADPENIIVSEDESNNNQTLTIPISGPFELNILSRMNDMNFLGSFAGSGLHFTSHEFGVEGYSMEYDTVPRLFDYDYDGDLDLITGSLDGRIVSYENTGNAENPLWKDADFVFSDWTTSELASVTISGRGYPTTSILSLDIGARSAPAFVDLDGDGAKDLVFGSAHGFLRSYKRAYVSQAWYNPSTNQWEQRAKGTWLEWNYNLSKVNASSRSVPTFANLDNDSDYDLIVGDSTGRLLGYENVNNNTHPDWMEHESDFNLTGVNVGSNAAPELKDWDGDGDADLVVGSGSGIRFFENIGTAESPSWQELNISLELPARVDFKPGLGDLDGDGNLDLLYGSNNFSQIPIRKGYLEPMGMQVINYAMNEIDIAQIGISVVNVSTHDKITDIFLDGPFGVDVLVGAYCQSIDQILKGYRLGPESAFEHYYDIEVPQDMVNESVISVSVAKQDNVNPGYYYELGGSPCGANQLKRGSKGPAIFIDRPELGGPTYDLYVNPGETYEYKGSYRIFFNGSMSDTFDCSYNWCAMYNLTVGEENTIVGSGELRRLTHQMKEKHDIVRPDKPPIELQIENKFGMELHPGYIEDVIVTVTNYNKRPYNIDRIAIELFDRGDATGEFGIGQGSDMVTLPKYANGRIISLFTDTNGFNLAPQATTRRVYKVYIPDGVPLDAMLLVKGVEKRQLKDNEYDRSNIAQLWPGSNNEGLLGGEYFGSDLPPASPYNISDITQFNEPYPWGKQDFQFGDMCLHCGADGIVGPGCDNEKSFLRKQMWIPNTLIKSEQKLGLQQNCCCGLMCSPEPPSGVSTWFNGKFKSSSVTECENIIFGWTPNFEFLSTRGNNEFDLFSFGPHRQYEMLFYDAVAVDYMPNVTKEPRPEAFMLNITSIGENGLLRRQYEEVVNVTVVNNDDDQTTVDAITFDLITPQNKKIHLLTDTVPRTVPPESNIQLSYKIIVPTDVPLNSRMKVQVERVFSFPDKLWNRDKEVSMELLLAENTTDYHWGDTLPTGDVSRYRKHFFVPRDVTRAEMILGDMSFTTDAYLNGEFQGSGYPGWSPISIDSGLREGQENILSVTGAIPYTDSRIYSGKIKTEGRVIEAEADVFYAVFGMREHQFIPGREPFYVLPGEDVTARIRVENKFDKRLDFTMTVSVVDFQSLNEIPLRSVVLTVLPYETKDLEVDLVIPSYVSNQTRLQLASVWNELVEDKNWLRGSNFNDDQAMNKFLDDTQWGVIALGSGNERAIYFRRLFWIDATVEGIRISKTGVSKMWVNGLEVVGSTFKNEFTKSENNLITLKAANFDIDADITLDHFVPVRSTDLEIVKLNATVDNAALLALSQGNVSCLPDQSLCLCDNLTLGECTYLAEKGDVISLNFTVRNAGELFAKSFELTVYAKNLQTGLVTLFVNETLTMHPFSTDFWQARLNTSRLAGLYEFSIFPDAEDSIIETSEYNNIASRKVYVNAEPKITYLDTAEVQGYGAPEQIIAEILDEDMNLETTTLTLSRSENDTRLLDLDTSGNISVSSFNGTMPGRYDLTLFTADEIGKGDSMQRFFDLYDSIYFNVKTERDAYYYRQIVKLTGSKLSLMAKVAPRHDPILLSAKDGADEIKGGEPLVIKTDAYDQDGDLLTLFVCKEANADAKGCIGMGKTVCKATSRENPSCTFIALKDDAVHAWFAFVVDDTGRIAGPISDTYTTDSTPPSVTFFSVASDKETFLDDQDDGKTLVVVQGEDGMRCRIGKDELYRYHKDRSYPLLSNDCSVVGDFAVCNLGNVTKNDPSKDRMTNLTRAYVSCIDRLGNVQENTENVDIFFMVEPDVSVSDDYDGRILAPGEGVGVSGWTQYCIDDNSRCIPDFVINNTPIQFNSSGVFHFRYLSEGKTKDTTVFVNTPLALGNQSFADISGLHAFDVSVPVRDDDSQNVTCTLLTPSAMPMGIKDGRAFARIVGSELSAGTLVTSYVTCSDGMMSASTDSVSHRMPNTAPFMRNMPDFSLDVGGFSSIDITKFGFDLENDSISYEIVNQSNTTVANAVLAGWVLHVAGFEIGSSQVCFRAADMLDTGDQACIMVFVETGNDSKVRNNEFSNTSIRVLMDVQYDNNGSWEDEYSKMFLLPVLPGGKNQIGLKNLFSWNSSFSRHPAGTFRVLIRGVDEFNLTLWNRDYSFLWDEYNFTLILFNTAPNITGIPDRTFFVGQDGFSFDLRNYTRDNEQHIPDISFVMDNNDSSLVNCTLANVSIVSCALMPNMTGTAMVNVSAFDGFAYGYAEFRVKIVSFEAFTQASPNLTFRFLSDVFNLSGDPYSGFRSIVVPTDTPSGTYNVRVIVSDGVAQAEGNITVVVENPGYPVLEHIGDRSVMENMTLVIDVNASDPDNDTLTYNTDAGSVLPSGYAFDSATGFFEWTPGIGEKGVYNVTFSVTDGIYWDNETIAITVFPELVPEAPAIVNGHVYKAGTSEGVPNMTVNVTCNTLGPVTGLTNVQGFYVVTFVGCNVGDTAVACIGMNCSVGIVMQIGDYQIAYINLETTLNRAPVLNAIGNKLTNATQTLDIQLNASDPDNDVLTFTTDAGSILPSQFSFDENTGLFSWTPNVSDVGTYFVTFNVTDGSKSDTETMRIVVRRVGGSVIANGHVYRTGTSHGLANVSVNITCNSIAIRDMTNEQGYYVKEFLDDCYEGDPVTACAEDGTDGICDASAVQRISGYDIVYINLESDLNRPPALADIGDKQVIETEPLSFNLSAADPDHDELTFTSDAGSVLPTPFYFNPATGEFRWTPLAGDAGSYAVTFGVTDGTFSDNETITITVTPDQMPALVNGHVYQNGTHTGVSNVTVLVYCTRCDGIGTCTDTGSVFDMTDGQGYFVASIPSGCSEGDTAHVCSGTGCTDGPVMKVGDYLIAYINVE